MPPALATGLVLRFAWPLPTLARADEPTHESPRQRAERSAERWIREADDRFRSGDAAASIPLLERAYAETGWHGCLLNLGMAHHALGRCPAARDYYERYLDVEPYDERRAEVEAALHELLQHCAPEPASLDVSPAENASDIIAALPPSVQHESGDSAPPERQSASRGGVSAAGELRTSSSAASNGASSARSWALAGVGLAGASAVGALAMLVYGERLEQRARHLAARGQNPENDATAREVDADGQRANALALGFGLGALALLGTSAAVFLLDSEGEGAVSFASAGASAGMLTYSARF